MWPIETIIEINRIVSEKPVTLEAVNNAFAQVGITFPKPGKVGSTPVNPVDQTNPPNPVK